LKKFGSKYSSQVRLGQKIFFFAASTSGLGGEVWFSARAQEQNIFFSLPCGSVSLQKKVSTTVFLFHQTLKNCGEFTPVFLVSPGSRSAAIFQKYKFSFFKIPEVQRNKNILI
jgi:hypothetical protein